MRARKAKIFFLIFILVSSFGFFNWSQDWRYLKINSIIEQAYALNKTNNWNFNGNSTGWTATNGSANTDGKGSPACSTTADTTQNSMATFAYNGALSGQTAFSAISGTTKGAWYAGNINQTIVAPGSGAVKAKGKFSYYGNGNFGTSKVSLEIWNNSNTTYVGSLGCVVMTANTAWTATAFSSDISLTGGTTYTIRVNFVSKNLSSTAGAITLGVDNVVVNFAPTGLSVSAPAATTNALLNFATSTAGSGANSLNATTPYKVYRDFTSPVSTFLANSSTTSYTDSSTSGNTTYYYAVSDVDTAGDESPTSSEASILTLPAAPTSVNFTNIQQTTLTVNWTAPSGGAASYKVERCQGTGCSGFSQITSGDTNTFYNDSGLTSSTTYRYQVRATNATGDGAYSTPAEVSTIASPTVSCSANITSKDFGVLSESSIVSAIPNTSTTISCSGSSAGCTLYIKDLGNGTGSPGLYKNTAPVYLIPSADAVFSATSTLSPGIEGYGIQATTTPAGSGGIAVIADRYIQSGNVVGGLATSNQILASSTAAITDREIIITHKAAISGLTLSGSYSDTITYSCVGN